MEITFLGATGTVTGSKYLLSLGSRRILVDCGLFQGYKQLRLRNREPLPVDPREIDAVVLGEGLTSYTTLPQAMNSLLGGTEAGWAVFYSLLLIAALTWSFIAGRRFFQVSWHRLLRANTDELVYAR